MRDSIRLRRRGSGFVVGVERREDGTYIVVSCQGSDVHAYSADEATALGDAIKKTAESARALNEARPPSLPQEVPQEDST